MENCDAKSESKNDGEKNDGKNNYDIYQNLTSKINRLDLDLILQSRLWCGNVPAYFLLLESSPMLSQAQQMIKDALPGSIIHCSNVRPEPATFYYFI